jgi:hypothetical protein
MPSPEREQAVAYFSASVAQAIVQALHERPPVVQLPPGLLEAFSRLTAQAQPPQAQVVLDPIAAMQQQLRLQGRIAPNPSPAPGLRPYAVMRYDDNGKQYIEEATIPQLLAEMCDLMHDQAALLEQIAAQPRRRRKKDAAFAP